jgi:energy-coupling factor transporter ATP-binding protein EcfA2
MSTIYDIRESIRRVKARGRATGKILILGQPGSGKSVYLRQLQNLDQSRMKPWGFESFEQPFLDYTRSRGTDRVQRNTDPGERRWISMEVTTFRLKEVANDIVASGFEVPLKTWDVSGEAIGYSVFEVDMEKSGVTDQVRQAVASLKKEFQNCSAVMWFVACSDIVPPNHPSHEKSANLENLVFQLAQELPRSKGGESVPVVVVLSCADVLIADRETEFSRSFREAFQDPNKSIGELSILGENYLRSQRPNLHKKFIDNLTEVYFIPVSSWGGPGKEVNGETIEPSNVCPLAIEKPIIAICDSLLRRFRNAVAEEAAIVEKDRMRKEKELEDKQRLEAESHAVKALFKTIRLTFLGGLIVGAIWQTHLTFWGQI